MSAPLYFLPNLRRAALVHEGLLSRAILRERGLDGLWSDCTTDAHVSVNELSGRGPENLSGLILCALPTTGPIPRRIGYYPKEQKWKPAGKEARYWIGLDTAERVRPEDLVRRNTYSGYEQTLRDGNEWEFPILRSPMPSLRTSLPVVMTYNDEGSYTERVAAEYEALWNDAKWLYDVFYSEESTRRLDSDKALDWCLRGLALNYRFDKWLNQRLELFDSTNYEDCLGALIDLPLAKEVLAQEKKRRDAEANGQSSTQPGQPDDLTVTAPASAS